MLIFLPTNKRRKSPLEGCCVKGTSRIPEKFIDTSKCKFSDGTRAPSIGDVQASVRLLPRGGIVKVVSATPGYLDLRISRPLPTPVCFFVQPLK